MPSQYMPYRAGDLLKAADVNTLLASVPFYTNSGSMGVGTDSVVVPPNDNTVWINVTESIASKKLKSEDVHPYGVIYGVPRKSKGTSDNSGKEGQTSFGNWVFYSKRQKSSLCQAFYTLTGLMSPIGLAPVASAEQLLQAESPEKPLGDSGDGSDGGDDSSGGGENSSGGENSGETAEIQTQTTPLGDMRTDLTEEYIRALRYSEILSYQQALNINAQGIPSVSAPSADTLSDQLFVLVTPMVPGGRYVLDVNNDFDDEPLSPGEEYVYDADTNRLKKVKSGEASSSDMVVHRRRYHPKTKAYEPGMDPRFALGDDNLIWCGGEGYFSGHVGNPLDPPEGFEIGPVYRIEYGDEVFVGKFSLKDNTFWIIDTGYIVPGWVDRNTGLSVPHYSSSSSSSLLQATPLLGDGPGSTEGDSGTTEDDSDKYLSFGQFAKHDADSQKSCQVEIVYTPISTTETVAVEQELATVRLPISSRLLPDVDIAPNPTAPLSSDGDGLYSDDPATYPNFSGENNTSRVAYSYLVAKSLGLVEVDGSTPTYQEAYYAIEDTKRAFCKTVTVVVEADHTNNLKPELSAGIQAQETGWENVNVIQYVILSSSQQGTRYSIECICFGTYEQETPETAEEIKLNLGAGSNTTEKLYVQKVEVDSDSSSGYAKYVPLSNGQNDSAASDTSGWVRYRYYDELEKNQRREKFTITPPSGLTSHIVDVTETTWKTDRNEQISPIWCTPFWSSYGLNYGDVQIESITRTKATLYFYPYGIPQENNNEENNGEQNTSTAPKYDQYHSFPFVFNGLAPARRTRITTKTYKAQRSDWVPAICKTLDHNEVLIPGMVVEIEDEAHTTIKDHDFTYYSVTPPESYATALEGTPEQAIYEIGYEKPSPTDLDEGYLVEDDCWIKRIKKLEDTDELKTNLPTGTIYRFSIKTNDNGTPVIREPFGAFNDCGNKGSLTVFLRTTAWGVGFTCTSRLDFIPFGYAVPSKTPSCYYKTGGDDCSVSLVSTKYVVKRLTSDTSNKLYLTGACYVPCSTLTSLG